MQDYFPFDTSLHVKLQKVEVMLDLEAYLLSKRSTLQDINEHDKQHPLQSCCEDAERCMICSVYFE